MRILVEEFADFMLCYEGRYLPALWTGLFVLVELSDYATVCTCLAVMQSFIIIYFGQRGIYGNRSR